MAAFGGRALPPRPGPGARRRGQPRWGRSARYTRPDELHQAFAFLTAPWDTRAWQSIATELLDEGVRGGAPVTWVVENHDVVRSPTRYGGGARGAARARAALLAVLGLPGAAYLYQGQSPFPLRAARSGLKMHQQHHQPHRHLFSD